jgi:ATP-dependent DNA helicase RecQ
MDSIIRDSSFDENHGETVSSREAAQALFRPQCLCLDIETSTDAEVQVHKMAAWRADTGKYSAFQGRFSAVKIRTELDELSQGASFLLGHNVTGHDLPVLAKLYPGLALHRLPVIDTLWLSPLAFPQNPYHSLVKDYKLVKDTCNDPLKDAQLSFRLFNDQFAAFKTLHLESPDELACYHFLLSAVPGSDYDRLFTVLRSKPKPQISEVRGFFQALIRDKVCSTRLGRLLEEDLPQVDVNQHGNFSRCQRRKVSS